MAEQDLKIVVEAINNASKQLKQIEKDLGGLNKSVQEQDASAKSAALSFGQLVAGVAKGSIIAKVITTSFRKLVEVTREASNAIYEMAVTSSEVEGLGIAMHIVANNAGITAEAVDKVRDAVVEQNITTEAANRLLTDLIRNQLDYAQATDLATAAQDLAVASGMSSSETIERISHAISSGNTWLLRQMGLTQHLNETYDNYAATLGKTSEELTAMERKQAVVNYVLEEGEKYVGAYDAAMGNAAKKMRSAKDKMKELSYTVGKVFNDSLYKVVDTVYRFIDSLVDFAHENSDKLIAIGQAMAKWVDKAITSIRAFLEKNTEAIYNAVNFVIQAFGKFSAGLKQVLNVIQIAVNGIEILAVSLARVDEIIYSALAGDWEKVASAWDSWLHKADDLTVSIKKNWQDITDASGQFQRASTFDLKKWWDGIEAVEGSGWVDRLKDQDEALNKMSAQQQKAYKKMLEDLEKENKKYTRAVEKRVKAFQESFDDLVIRHRDTIESLTEDIKSETEDYSKHVAELLKGYNEAVEDMEKRHEEKTKSVLEDMEDEREKTKEITDEISKLYNQEVELLKREGEARVGDLQAQLDREKALGENANQTKIEALNKMLEFEKNGLQGALDNKEEVYNEEIQKEEDKLQKKLDKLQTELDEEKRMMSEALADRKTDYDEDVQNLMDSHKKKIDDLNETLDEELVIREKFAEDFKRIGDRMAEDDLTRMVRKHQEELVEMERDHNEKLNEIEKYALESGIKLAEGWRDGIVKGTPMIKQALNQIESDIDRITNKVNNFSFGGGSTGGYGATGGWGVGDLYTKMGVGSNLPGFGQMGGVFSKPTIVGEAGAEVVLPLNFPKRMAQIMQSMGMGGGSEQQVTQNFYVTVNNQQDVDVLMERAGFAMKQGGF